MTPSASTPSNRDERLDVIEVLHRFARGIDSRDFALYRSVFADQIDLGRFASDAPRTPPPEDTTLFIRKNSRGMANERKAN